MVLTQEFCVLALLGGRSQPPARTWQKHAGLTAECLKPSEDGMAASLMLRRNNTGQNKLNSPATQRSELVMLQQSGVVSLCSRESEKRPMGSEGPQVCLRKLPQQSTWLPQHPGSNPRCRTCMLVNSMKRELIRDVYDSSRNGISKEPGVRGLNELTSCLMLWCAGRAVAFTATQEQHCPIPSSYCALSAQVS